MLYNGAIRTTTYCVLTGVGVMVAHECSIPPAKRKEHAEEAPPAMAVDLGVTLSIATNTTDGSRSKIEWLSHRDQFRVP